MIKNTTFKKTMLAVLLLGLVGFLKIPSFAMTDIKDEMLTKALNNSIKQYIPDREETEEILEADVSYVKDLNASGYGITDIHGLEQFVYIESTIDLSSNNISDITPLMEWFDNKDDNNLSVNIFLGSNPALFNNNYEQINTLLAMGENIRVYDSKRDGGGVVEITGFVDGRPVNNIGFDQTQTESTTNQDKVEVTSDDVVDTGTVVTIVYILIGCVMLFVFARLIYSKRRDY